MNWHDLPPLSGLRAFTALAEAGSYVSAADVLGVSHAAVSQQVRTLETRLGAALVEKHGRGIRLTADGLALAHDLRLAFATMTDAIGRLTHADETRPLHITMTPSFAISWLMPRISEFRRSHPDIATMLDPTPNLVELAPGGADIAIRYGTGKWPGLEAEPLLLSSIAIVAARSLVGDTPPASPADILNFPWLQETGTNEISTWLSAQGVFAPKEVASQQLPGYLVLDGVRRGDGICATARVFVEEDIQRGDLVLLFEDVMPGNGYWIVTRPGVMRPPLRSFVTWLRRQVRI